MTVIIIDLLLSLVLSQKVVEKVILNRISEYLLTTCNQFGFKKQAWY